VKPVVLIATSTKETADLIQFLLGDNFDVKTVFSEIIFIDSAIKNMPVLCIVDGKLRTINAYDICAKVKDKLDLGATSFILLGANKDQWNESRAKMVSLNSFIEMPAKNETLLKEMEKLINQTLEQRKLTYGENDFNRNYSDQKPIALSKTESVENDENPFVTSSDQYDSIGTNPTKPGSDNTEDVIIKGDQLYTQDQNGEQEESEEIPLITTPNSEIISDLRQNEESANDDSYIDPVSDFMERDFINENNIVSSNKPDTGQKSILDQTPNPVIDKEYITGGHMDKEIKDLIIARVESILTEQEMERIVTSAVDEKLSKALSVMSGRIQKVIFQTVEKELARHLEDTIEAAVKNSGSNEET